MTDVAGGTKRPGPDSSRCSVRFGIGLTSARPPPPIAQVDPYGPNLFQAMNDQLRLELEPRTRALDIMVVDHIEPPTEN
jgi:uncharacterized protein (TIGR03435 family)